MFHADSGRTFSPRALRDSKSYRCQHTAECIATQTGFLHELRLQTLECSRESNVYMHTQNWTWGLHKISHTRFIWNCPVASANLELLILLPQYPEQAGPVRPASFCLDVFFCCLCNTKWPRTLIFLSCPHLGPQVHYSVAGDLSLTNKPSVKWSCFLASVRSEKLLAGRKPPCVKMLISALPCKLERRRQVSHSTNDLGLCGKRVGR